MNSRRVSQTPGFACASAPTRERVETSASAICRIESGQDVTQPYDAGAACSALEVKLLVGFETEADDREFVSV